MNNVPVPTNDKENENIRRIDVIDVVRLTDEDDIEVLLLIFDFIQRQYVLEDILRTEISPESIRRVILKHAGICTDAKKDCKFILNKVDKLLFLNTTTSSQISAKHFKLGWVFTCDLYFNAHQQYSVVGVENSVYSGTYAVTPTGCLDDFVVLFNTVLIDNVPMQAVMCMAAAATVLPYANQMWGLSLYNPINHLIGNSTTGKTTAAYLFASFGGAPEGRDGFMFSFLGTENAIIKQVGNIAGYPIAIDEFSTGLSKTGWSNFVYTMANGRGKVRCQAGGSRVQQVDEFSTVFLTTGEMSILRKCNKNEGIRARLFEYQLDTSWTRSAEESDLIKSVCKRNYGLITPLIAQELLKNGAAWESRFRKWRERTIELIRAKKLLLGISDRVSDFVALYMVSCEILMSVLGIEMKKYSIFDFFFLHILVKNAQDANLGMRTYETIVAYLSKNRHLYPELVPLGDDFIMESDIEGFIAESHKGKVINGKKYRDYAVFDVDILDTVLLRRGFSDPKVALRALQKDGYLLTKDKNRLYIERRVNGITTRVYGVWVDISW